MKLLLDTHALLWFLADDPKLSVTAKTAIEDPANERWLSPVSLVEIAVKVRTGKMRLSAPFGAIFPSKLLAAKIALLPIESHHVEPLATLPLHHRDPFDRVIVATALVEGMRVVSVDTLFDTYGVSRLW